ncbi:pentapeptide repeat-containing protein [Naasia sp. SYSU D00948]|uniref:pentapeptide repeat-containing protein n=1 Tax=Naasia sp. SYSU D00948 TaxID=2817379 RepID=UPI001B303AA0|nr:pentapeptide repeat-containing protein [Naasia sp. SYSU D00948]
MALLVGAAISVPTTLMQKVLDDQRSERELRIANLQFVREHATADSDRPRPFAGLDLRGQELSGLQLRGADFSRADLTDADFYGSDLRHARFDSAVLVGANFIGADLTGASFGGTDLRGALLAQATLDDAFFGRSSFGRADFLGSSMIGTRFLGTPELGSDYEVITLRDTTVVGAEFDEVVVMIDGGRLWGSSFIDSSVRAVGKELPDVEAVCYRRDTLVERPLNFPDSVCPPPPIEEFEQRLRKE